MANFLIQTIDGQVRHDFSFALVEAIDYQNWLNKGTHDYILTDINDMFEHDYEGYIPSGTIQFVKKFLDSYHDIHKITPINIPNALRLSDYLKRKVEFSYLTKGDNLFENDKFIKCDIEIKGLTEIAKKVTIPEIGRYLVSDLIDIESEWRAFVCNRQMVGLQNYLGDFTMFPDVNLIREMIDTYKDSPPAYTLDVGINKKDGTFVIEVHNFYSCGLYGFSDNKIIPQMFIGSFRHLLKNKF